MARCPVNSRAVLIFHCAHFAPPISLLSEWRCKTQSENMLQLQLALFDVQQCIWHNVGKNKKHSTFQATSAANAKAASATGCKRSRFWSDASTMAAAYATRQR